MKHISYNTVNNKFVIPHFDHNNVIPPHLGNPASHRQISPYVCGIMEFCEHFSTSKERVAILKGFVNFRIEMSENGIVNGYQWIDGSFTENIEISEKRSPNDINVVSLFKGMSRPKIGLQKKVNYGRND